MQISNSKRLLEEKNITHLPPAQLAADILKKKQRITEIMGTIQKFLAKSNT